MSGQHFKLWPVPRSDKRGLLFIARGHRESTPSLGYLGPMLRTTPANWSMKSLTQRFSLARSSAIASAIAFNCSSSVVEIGNGGAIFSIKIIIRVPFLSEARVPDDDSSGKTETRRKRPSTEAGLTLPKPFSRWPYLPPKREQRSAEQAVRIVLASPRRSPERRFGRIRPLVPVAYPTASACPSWTGKLHKWNRADCPKVCLGQNQTNENKAGSRLHRFCPTMHVTSRFVLRTSTTSRHASRSAGLKSI